MLVQSIFYQYLKQFDSIFLNKSINVCHNFLTVVIIDSLKHKGNQNGKVLLRDIWSYVETCQEGIRL